MKKYNEKIIIKSGKPIYAITLEDKKSNGSKNSTYIYIDGGSVTFSDNWYNNMAEFDFCDEAHVIAKEIFTSQLRVDIKKRILELKQLENIFADIGLDECFGTVLVDNTKLLLELRSEIQSVDEKVKANTKEVMRVADNVAEEIKVTKNDAKNIVTEAIKENIKPIALNKKKKD